MEENGPATDQQYTKIINSYIRPKFPFLFIPHLGYQRLFVDPTFDLMSWKSCISLNTLRLGELRGPEFIKEVEPLIKKML